MGGDDSGERVMLTVLLMMFDDGDFRDGLTLPLRRGFIYRSGGSGCGPSRVLRRALADLVCSHHHVRAVMRHFS